MTAPQPAEGLRWAHYVVAQGARAAVGLVGPEIRAIGCSIDEERVALHFAVPSPTDAVRAGVEEIAFELDVLLEGNTRIETHIHSDGRRLDWTELHPIYEARPEPGSERS